MKRQFLSIILSVTLLASAIAGAISVSIKTVFADDPSGDVLYWADFREQMLNLTLDTNHTSQMIAIFNEIDNYWENQTFNVWVMIDPDGNISLLSLLRQNGDGFKGSGWTGPEEYQLTSGAYPSYFRLESSFVYANGSFRWVSDAYSNISNPPARRSIIDMTTVGTPEVYYCTPFEMQAAGWQCYSLRDMTTGNAGGYSMTANIVEGHYVPPVVEFTWVKFNIGERWFLTVADQSYVYGLWNDGEGGFNRIFFRFYADWMEDPLDNVWLFQLSPSNMSTVPAVNAPTSLSNISGDHFYAFDITELIDDDIQGVTDGRIIHYIEDTQGEIVRATELATHEALFSFVLTPDQENISLDQAWQQINEYYNTYNTTHVVPQDLAEVLFGLNGSQMYPCNISVPATVWDNSPEADGGTSAAPIHNWKWWYPSGNDVNIGFNYDLFDTVILTYSSSGEYTLINYYDDTLTNPFMAVSNLTFDQIVNQFDIVIIVPDDDGCLSNTWWKTVMNTILNNLGADLPFDFLNTQAIAGSGSQGIEHISSRPDRNAHILQGFAILTYKAIQKQQLWNFNDGITKLYQLQVDYIESEDLWKDSFLLWSSSVFNMLNSLDGRLNTINTNILSISSLLESIKTAVDHIAEDPDPDNVSPWYLSLWNFVKQFNPSNDQISQGIDALEDNLDDIPLLPALTPVPALPTLGG